MTPTLTRRQLVGSGLAGAATLALPLPAGAARRAKRPLAAAASFPSGVASGLPSETGITLWTQADGLERTSRLVMEVAKDPDFKRVVRRQGVLATSDHGYAAKARVSGKGLLPGEEYFYRFATRTTSSPVGRFRTARPADSQEALRIGFFSCQKYTEGLYTSHAALAAEDCDAIVCLGDYLYETNADEVRKDATSQGENGQCETLAEYRAKYRLYRSDPNLQAMHASAAFLTTWDDHEVENDHAGTHPGTTETRRIPYEQRRQNAYAAWFEHMPTDRFGEDSDRVYRRVRLGGLAEVFLLDLRQYRDDQPCDGTQGVPCPESYDPARTMMGTRQREWLQASLADSSAAWKVLGSSVEMMAWDSAPHLALNPDGWDGYQAERRALATYIRDKGIKDVTTITGDIHMFVAGDVTLDGRASSPAVATEFVGGSVTSSAVDGPLGELLKVNNLTNPHWRYVDFTRHGYGVMDLTPQGLKVRFRSPTSIKVAGAPVETIAEFQVARGTPRVERIA